MKVYIAKYKNWYGPYHVTEKLFWFLSEDAQDKIAKRLPVWPFEFIRWLRGPQKIQVRVDSHDTWNMDNTLAHIIVPMLKQLKAQKPGVPDIDDEDVPEHLKHLLEKDVDERAEIWNWIMDEMIWAFEQKTIEWDDQYYSEPVNGTWTINNPMKVDKEGLEAHHNRMKNGFRLFGRYYECLWS